MGQLEQYLGPFIHFCAKNEFAIYSLKIFSTQPGL